MRNTNLHSSLRQARVKGLVLAAAICTAQAIWSPTARGADAAPDATHPPTTQPVVAPEDAALISKGLDAKGNGISLTVNQSRLITTTIPVRAVDVTQPEIVGIKVITPTELVLTARKPGSAQLVLWDDRQHSVTVDVTIEADLKALRAELERDLPDVHVEVSSANGTVVIKGHVPTVEVSQKVVEIATPFGAKVVNLMDISGGQQITLQVRFAEVSKDAISALGVNFGTPGGSGFGANVIGGIEPFGVVPSVLHPDTVLFGIPSPTATVTQFGQFTLGHTPFDIFLEALEQNNLLRTLAEPNLTVMSGSTASFLAGGEFPYPVPQPGGTGTTITIEYKEYGVKLNFTPVVLGDGRIRLHVQPEVSDLDYAHSLTLEGFVIPGLTTRNADTIVELAPGQTLSLAGLLDQRVTATSSATPLLGDIPILGALFRSVRYERTETELVVLVTPMLAGAMNPGQVPASPGERWRYPTPAQLYANGDMGGPTADAYHGPAVLAPRQFHGTYGFAPAKPTAKPTTVPAGK